MPTLVVFCVLLITALAKAATHVTHPHWHCRNQPGDHLFPTAQQLSQFNDTIEGRLIPVVPSAQFCKQHHGGCTDAEWTNSVFRSNIPGAMLQANWEQDYASKPPSLCFRNITTCGQGAVPVYAVNATSATHIQAGIHFAQKHNLKVAIKASGHDLLGRSTAKNSLLLWTRHLENITFHESFNVGGKDKGTAVSVGSGVGLHVIYQATKLQGKIFVGGTAGNVVAAGGYVQGAGHSALGPLYGLAADNALEFEIVIASGDLVTVNEVSHADLFWALRGGRAGSWGVIISATFRTFPTFDIVKHRIVTTQNSTSAFSQLMTLNAQHIFDWDDLHASQYQSILAMPQTVNSTFDTYFPKSSIAAANSSMAPFINAITSQGIRVVNISIDLLSVNDALSPTSSDMGGQSFILGSRLISADVYRRNATEVGEAYQKLIVPGQIILGAVVAGGRVAENGNVSSAVNPKWRTAKSLVIIGSFWDDSTPPSAVESIRQDLTKNKVPILDALAGPDGGSYSNEGDVREPAFQTTFFGPNYARLTAIKREYEPEELFIVRAGVGSENWDADGLCRV